MQNIYGRIVLTCVRTIVMMSCSPWESHKNNSRARGTWLASSGNRNPTRVTTLYVADTFVICLAQALEMPTLKLHVDAYRLLRSAHRLSDATRHAITGATQDSKNGLWSLDCSPEVASELPAWFDDCERHAALLSRESWKVNVCRRPRIGSGKLSSTLGNRNDGQQAA